MIFIFVIISYFVFKTWHGSVKHSTVQNAFLAKITFDKLNEKEKEKVRNQANAILIRGDMNNEYASKFYHELSDIYRFSIMALAMAELNIQPCLRNEKWHYVKRPFEPLNDVKHQIEVVKHHFIKSHNINIDFN